MVFYHVRTSNIALKYNNRFEIRSNQVSEAGRKRKLMYLWSAQGPLWENGEQNYFQECTRTLFALFSYSLTCTVGFSRGYIIYDDDIALMANEMCACIFFLKLSALISNTVILINYNPHKQKFVGVLGNF